MVVGGWTWWWWAGGPGGKYQPPHPTHTLHQPRSLRFSCVSVNMPYLAALRTYVARPPCALHFLQECAGALHRPAFSPYQPAIDTEDVVHLLRLCFVSCDPVGILFLSQFRSQRTHQWPQLLLLHRTLGSSCRNASGKEKEKAFLSAPHHTPIYPHFHPPTSPPPIHLHF